MQVNVIEEAENETTNGVEEVRIRAETQFETIALGKLANLLSEEEGYEQLISFLFGGRNKALEVYQRLESEGN